jgi:hypothetical protein
MKSVRLSRWYAAAVVVASAMFVPLVSSAGDTVLFKFDFKEGHKRDYRVKYTQEMSMREFSRSAFVDMEITEKCMGKREDGRFDMQIDFNKVESSLMMFDKMQESNTGEVLKGRAVSFILDKNGKTEQIKPVGFIEGWGQVEGDLESVIEGLYTYLPGEEVAKGKGWQHEEEKTQSEVTTKTHADYVFKELKKDGSQPCAVVEGISKYEVTGVNATPAGEFTVDGKGKGKLEMCFDPVELIIVKMKNKVQVLMDMTPVSGGADKMETTIGIELERTLL